MILDPQGGWNCAQAIEPLMQAIPAEIRDQVKPELMKSVLKRSRRSSVRTSPRRAWR